MDSRTTDHDGPRAANWEGARSEGRYALAVRAGDDGIWDWDLVADRIYLSPRWHTILGQPEQGADSEPSVWFDLVHPDDLLKLRAAIDAHVAGHSGRLESEHRIRHADGSWRWVLCHGLAIRGPDGTATRMAGSLCDITERRGREHRLQHDALHDGLTGLPNRALLTDRLDQMLQRATRDPSVGCAVVLLDVDHLCHVNDSYSRAIADRLLSALGRRLSGILRPGDTAARWGGDEFMLLLDAVKTVDDAHVVADRLESAIAQPFSVDSNELRVTIGIGIAISEPGVLAADLLGRAELAMYHAKQHGLGKRAVFDHTMHSRIAERAVRESELRRAVERSLLPVHYQPIVELGTGRIRGLEALARSPEGWPEVAPLDLILTAEETGVIGALGLHVLRTSLDTLASWRRAGLIAEDVCISVNVSGPQLDDPRLPAMLRAAIAGAALPPSSLRLDISESALLQQPERVRSLAAELATAGVGVHLDDFGTASSSFAALHSMPVEALKIDRSYVASLGDLDGTAEAIVRSTVALAHSLGLTVIAEGIEDELQLQRLRELGCKYGQGFLFAPPQNAEDTQMLLMSWSPRDVVSRGKKIVPLGAAGREPAVTRR